MINLIKNINYRDLIGYYYYISDYIPYAIIDNVIKMPNNYYRIYLKDIKNTKYLNYVDLTYEELLSLYNKLLIRKERSEILKKRNIEKIVHFTKVENLESIFENGILSVNRLNDSSIAYSPSDPFRLDDKLNMISTSISFPNYKMFYSKRMENTDIDWAVITIDPNLIIHKLDSEFYKTNAASGIYSFDYSPTSNNFLLDMFYDEGRDPNIPKSYPTDPQAEILINNKIPNTYFNSVETRKNISKVKSLTRTAGIDYNPNSHLFSYRSDYKRW